MNWSAITLEVGLFALAVVSLGWNLTAGHGRKGTGRGECVIGAATLVA